MRKVSGLLLLLAAAIAQSGLGQGGRIERGTLYSQALAGNLFHDPTTRPYAVYLPPSYDQSQRRYPVFYMLHGWDENLDTHLPLMLAELDSMILNRQIGEVISVFVDGDNALLGSFYRTSTATGDYESYIVNDLVPHIDTNYRTLATNVSRGITGFSMGGYGTLHLAFKYPNRFSVAVAQSGYYDVTDRYTDTSLKEIARVNPTSFAALSGLSLEARILFAFLPCAVPNPNRAPFFYDPPYSYNSGRYTTNQTTFQRLRNADVTHGDLGRFTQQPIRLRGLKIVHGSSDTLVPVSQARSLRQALQTAGVTHVYEEHSGDHLFLPEESLTFLSQWLVGGVLYIISPRLIATMTGDVPSVRFATQMGVNYEVEYASALDEPAVVWTRLTVVSGTGDMVEVALPHDTAQGSVRLRATNAPSP